MHEDRFHILLVEDDEIVADAMRMHFDAFAPDFRVAVAASGEEAIRAFEAELPDVIVLDVNLPGMDGVDVFNDVRRRRPEQPVIFYTSTSMSPRLSIAASAPHAAYYAKPGDITELATLIRKMC